jgi:hypothetical protein
MLDEVERRHQGQGRYDKTKPGRFPWEKTPEKHGSANDMKAKQKFKEAGAKKKHDISVVMRDQAGPNFFH